MLVGEEEEERKSEEKDLTSAIDCRTHSHTMEKKKGERQDCKAKRRSSYVF